MITCKEDLIGKVIRIRSKEDADLVMRVCARFGIYVGEWQCCSYVPFKSVAAKISHNHGNTYSCKLIFTDSYEEKPETAEEFQDLSDLTLSDLKPRTKVEYKKVTESIFDLKDEFESGNLFFKADTDSEYHRVDAIKVLGLNFDKSNLYRKVERQVEWWDDAVDYLKSNCKGVTAAGYCTDTNSIAITGHMNQEQCYDFARILLEQEGE